MFFNYRLGIRSVVGTAAQVARHTAARIVVGLARVAGGSLIVAVTPATIAGLPIAAFH